jgi:hypothetical protein
VLICRGLGSEAPVDGYRQQSDIISPSTFLHFRLGYRQL